MVALCIVLCTLRLYADPLRFRIVKSDTVKVWYGPDVFGTDRAHVEARLEGLPGRQLVIVRYAPSHDLMDEWVYNAPDVDNAKVVWAREMGPAHNLGLLQYYKGRNVWLVEPDTDPVKVSPYPQAVLNLAANSSPMSLAGGKVQGNQPVSVEP